MGNNKGFALLKAELLVHLQLLDWPTFVALNETLLDESSPATLEGYVLLSRRDRSDGRKGGGILLFAKEDVAASAVLLKHSEDDERSWHTVHTAQGPLLLGVWYRPSCTGEVASVERLEEEWLQHSEGALGTLVVGDLNVHHESWLRYSNSTTAEGRALRDFCLRRGFEERVRKPTRGKHLLDLVLTDLHTDVRCKVLPKVADHHAVPAQVTQSVPSEVKVARELWNWRKANWPALNDELEHTDWDKVLFGEGAHSRVELAQTLL